jgi:hypothetical protein
LRLVDDAGFEVEHFQSYGFPLANLIEPVRAIHHRRQLLRRAAGSGKPASKAAGSARSGVERTLETRLYPLQASLLGVAAMRFFWGFQSLFSGSDLGNGYLVLARRR